MTDSAREIGSRRCCFQAIGKALKPVRQPVDGKWYWLRLAHAEMNSQSVEDEVADATKFIWKSGRYLTVPYQHGSWCLISGGENEAEFSLLPACTQRFR